jgi:AAA domain
MNIAAELRAHGISPNGAKLVGKNEARVGANTWAPIDLTELVTGEYTQEAPALLRRSDGICLLYRERIHEIRGEPESGKSWLALHACAEQIAAGENVVYIDFEDSAPAVDDRLLELGADPGAIVRHFSYIRPDEPLVEIGPLLALKPTLAVIDGVTEALTIHGLDLRDNTDIAKWLALLPRPLQRTGAAVVLLDHVSKDKETRGRWSIGAQHKLAGVDVAYLLETVEPFGRGREGLVRITEWKDRPGFIRRHAVDRWVGNLRLASDHAPGVTCAVEAPAEKGVFRPTALMEKVSRLLEEQPGLSRRAVRTGVKGKNDYVDLALELLVANEFVAVERDGQARRHRVVRPYREAENSVQTTFEEYRAPPCPGLRGHGYP